MDCSEELHFECRIKWKWARLELWCRWSGGGLTGEENLQNGLVDMVSLVNTDTIFTLYDVLVEEWKGGADDCYVGEVLFKYREETCPWGVMIGSKDYVVCG